MEKDEVLTTSEIAEWMKPIAEYLDTGKLPYDKNKVNKIRTQAALYSLQNKNLYRRSFSHPWSKCISTEEGNYVLREIHEGICRAHEAKATIVRKALLQGYYWPIMSQDAHQLTQSCDKWQRFSQRVHTPSQVQSPIGSPWPFAIWGMDILGPFPITTGQKKFIIVEIDHFTKWIEVEAVPTIT